MLQVIPYLVMVGMCILAVHTVTFGKDRAWSYLVAAVLILGALPAGVYLSNLLGQ